MPGLSGYHALLDRLRKAAAADPQAFLAELRAAYGLAHVLYADLRREDDVLLPGTIVHGHGPDLERLIRNEGLSVLRPLFEAVSNLFGPAILDPSAQDGAAGHTAAREIVCRIDRPLLVFPLVPQYPGLAFLACVPGNMDESYGGVEWLQRDLAALAGLFHATQRQGPAPPPRRPPGDRNGPRLTSREREVLQWVARGKTYWEIARILGISERTVRYFMSACREKLDAVSNKQAVANAVAGRLIDVGVANPNAPPKA